MIRDEYDYERHVDYIHYNPVKHGHGERAVDWAHSSIHRYIRADMIERDWASDGEGGVEDSYGER